MTLPDGQEAHWEVVERVLFIYGKLNPGQGYVQVKGPHRFFSKFTVDQYDVKLWPIKIDIKL